MSNPVGNQFTPRTTPLHVYQLVLLLLKEMFRDLEDGHPLKYSDDPSQSRIAFDTIFNKDSDVYGTKPLVVVSRGDINSSPTVLGDMGVQHPSTMNSYRMGIVGSSTIIKIICGNSGQVDLLSNEIFNALMTIRVFIPSLTSVSTVTGVSLSPIAPYEEEDHLYYCVATMQYVMQYKWTDIIPQNLLNQINLYLTHPPSEQTREIVAGPYQE